MHASGIRPRSLALAWLGAALISAASPVHGEVAKPDFQRVIHPILSRNCFPCHGPDESHREADLRLDQREVAEEMGAIVPGDAEGSELVRRVTSDDESERMPPPESGHELTEAEQAILRDWIDAGAEYALHWAYEPPQKPPLPSVSDPGWCRNAIDHFILARLESQGLQPEPMADRYRLIRRLSLDLTGLPPTLEEVDAFVNDRSPDAYERLVDRLMESPAYGEHWARQWLDLARYADTCGYEKDSRRTMWPFRDWVIRALNADMPFDQFTIEQLAGDLLEKPTRDQLIATAFHRNTLQNDEGGTDDEEFRDAAVIDRVNTTMQVWMGTTMGCCQCHTHKYDPFTHREYYELFSFFNQTADADRYDQAPTLPTPSPQQREQKERLTQQLADCDRQLREGRLSLTEAQRRWEQGAASPVTWHPAELRGVTCDPATDADILPDDSVSLSNGDWRSCMVQLSIDLPRVTALRLEALPRHVGDDRGDPLNAFVISKIEVDADRPVPERDQVRFVRVELLDRHDYLSLAEVQVFSGDVNVARQGAASQISTAYEGPPQLAIDGRTDGHFATGRSVTHTAFEYGPWWEVDLGSACVVDRVVLWNRDEFSERLSDVQVTLLDGQRKPIWRRSVRYKADPSATLWVRGGPVPPIISAGASSEQDGRPAQDAIENRDASVHGWSPDPESTEPASIALGFETPIAPNGDRGIRLLVTVWQRADREVGVGAGTGGGLGRFRISASSDEYAATWAPASAELRQAASHAPAQRSWEQQSLLATHFASVEHSLKDLGDRRADIERRLKEDSQQDKTPIMRELPPAKQRKTYVHVRGSFLTPGEEVQPDVPEVFPPLPKDEPRNRLGLARWLVDRRNPLSARLAVNRHWQMLFGQGIVLTSEDFGSQGSPPSHPELLDWLAVELMDHGWSLKHLTRTIVLSAAYRQSSRTTPGTLERDPENRLISRGPRYRMSAEQIRDQALKVSGLLSRKMFGPSVMPSQPEGVWQVVYSDDRWKTSPGEDRFRRGLYTFWRRTSPYPSAMALDATSRDVCTVRRIRTNTPVAAFVLLNDPAFVETARALARRIVEHHSANVAERAAYGFRRVLGRQAEDSEIQQLVSLFQSEQAHYRGQLRAAKLLALGEAEETRDGLNINLPDLAAWTVVGNVLLNLDETLSN